MLQDQAQCILADHIRIRYPRQPTRFGRLLLLLPSLRAIRSSTIEALFFKETIGTVPISRLLGDMYQMEKYTSDMDSFTKWIILWTVWQGNGIVHIYIYCNEHTAYSHVTCTWWYDEDCGSCNHIHSKWMKTNREKLKII